MKEDVEFQFEAFKETLNRYFNIVDEEKAKDAFVFYICTHKFQEPSEEDLDWAQFIVANAK